MTAPERFHNEWFLVQQCLQGNKDAWQWFWDHYRRGLGATVRKHLGPQRHDPSLIEDVVSDILLALWKNDSHRLRSFDPTRGGLATFLNFQALHMVLLYFRQQHRDQPAPMDPDWLSEKCLTGERPEELEDFLATLTEKELLYCKVFLLRTLPSSALSAEEKKPAYLRQLRHRVWRKCKEYSGP